MKGGGKPPPFIILRKPIRLRDFMIAEQLHRILEGLGDEAVGLTVAVERQLRAVAAPHVSWQMDTVETGPLRGLTGKRRDFLVVQHEHLREYRVLVCGRAYGTALQASWFLMASPRIANDLVRALRLTEEKEGRYDVGAELDVFDMIDLNAFIGITRLALKKAITELTDDGEVEEGDRMHEFE